MFEELIKKLKELEQTKISIHVDADEKGYIDKECPSNECLFEFKVNEEDWKNLFNDESVFCPKCRHEAKSDSWWTTDQINNAREQGGKYIKGIIAEAMKNDARNFNSRQSKSGFIKMSMKVSASSQRYYLLPIPAKEEMQLEIHCEACNTRFAVIGSAFFCPCCGYNSVERTFEEAMKKIEIKLNSLDLISKAFWDEGKKDEAVITCTSLIESSLQDCISAFQRYSEEAYTRFAKATPGFNVFQRLDSGSELWKKILGKGYEDWLSCKELQDLNILFQKRHLLAHKEGIVDDKYILKSGDKNYKTGQKIVVKGQDVKMAICIIKIIVANVKSKTIL